MTPGDRVIELGPFDLDSPLGRGGMGQVWSGCHRGLGYPVAVKFLTARGYKKPGFRQAFRNEARAVAGLDHRNIVRVHDYGQADARTQNATRGAIPAGTPWLAMELVRGGTLSPLAGRLTWLETESVISSLLEALAHAHARGVIHRDLKPGNVLVVRSTVEQELGVKLTDFGLAQEVEAAEIAGGAPFPGGTPSYMSPEQFEGRWRDYGPWTDLYAAGCLFWCVVRGQPPFGATTSVQEKREHHLKVPPPPLEPPFDVPPGFERWLNRLLEKDPARRFRRAADAMLAFRRLGPPGAGVHAPPDKPSDVDTLLLGAQPTDPEGPVANLTTLSLPRDEPADTSLVVAVPTTDPPPLPLDWRAPDDDRGAPGEPVGLGLFGLRAVPLVDRERERDALWDLLHLAHTTGEVHAAVLSGPGGSGKSRLAEWLCQRAHEVGAAHVLRATHSPIPGPTHGLGPMLRSFLRCQDLERDAVRQRVRAILTSAGVTHTDEWEALTEVICPADDSTRGAIRFGSATERFVTVRRLLQAMSTERGIVLWLDDVHHALDSLRFAMYLLDYRARRDLPVLLILTVTDEALTERLYEATVLAELLEHDRCGRVEVGPLPPQHRAALVRGILGLEANLARRVEDRTAGNPLFAVQLVGDWVQRGLLEASPGGFRLREGAPAQLPADVHAMWAARVERMLARRTLEEGHALELAAVLGADVDPGEWGAACLRAQTPAHPSDPLINDLLDQRLARAGPEGPATGWSFAHAMLRESLETRARIAGRLPGWHHACAELLEDERRGTQPVSSAVAERIGRHWLGAGDPERAVPHLLAGARERANTGDYAVALQLLSQRDQALEQLGAAPHDVRWGQGWLLRCEIASRRGRWDEVEDHLDTAERAARLHHWPSIVGHVMAIRGRRARIQGRYPQALAYLVQVERDAAKRGDRALMASSRLEMGEVLLESGEVQQAQRWVRLALQECEALGDRLGTAACWQALGEAAKEAGDHAEASLQLRKAEALFDELGNRWKSAAAVNSQGDVARYQGDLDLAATLYRRARGLLKAIGSKAWVFPEYNTGLVHLQRGDVARARGMLELALEVFIEQGNTSALAHAHLALATCAAHDETWILWDEHLREARALLGATGSANEDTARLAARAGAAARKAEQDHRARDACELALALWTTLGRERERVEAERMLSLLG